MQSALATAVQRFTSPRDEGQLRELDLALSTVAPAACTESEFSLLLNIFERFPDEDGFGVFWSIVHLLEATTGYEPALVESVRRKPSEFNLLMINRLINGGTSVVAGQSLVSLLRAVSSSTTASPRAIELASGFVDFQKEHGHGEA